MGAWIEDWFEAGRRKAGVVLKVGVGRAQDGDGCRVKGLKDKICRVGEHRV